MITPTITFITGLARTDWLAVYLSFLSDQVSNRPLEKLTQAGIKHLDDVMGQINIDPFFPLFQDPISAGWGWW